MQWILCIASRRLESVEVTQDEEGGNRECSWGKDELRKGVDDLMLTVLYIIFTILTMSRRKRDHRQSTMKRGGTLLHETSRESFCQLLLDAQDDDQL